LFSAILGFTLLTPSAALTYDTRERVQEVVDELRDRLGIGAVVDAVIVPTNALLVSVEVQKDRPGAFELSFEADFIDRLDEEELRAVVAHELGHVWIFTHHPYLQTERLANDVAMRVVSRESLRKVYEKAWHRGGVKGDLARFLGQ
jgi:Peptidase family M48